MAIASEIEEVRLSTDEPVETSTYDDVLVGSLIDTYGLAGAAAKIWDAKAAQASKLVDVTEAGASHKLSAVFDHATKLSGVWADRAEAEATVTATTGRIQVKKIEQS